MRPWYPTTQHHIDLAGRAGCSALFAGTIALRRIDRAPMARQELACHTPEGEITPRCAGPRGERSGPRADKIELVSGEGGRTAPAGIDAVVFDLGGVLLDWNPRYVYRELFRGDESAMEAFLATVCTMEWHYQHDLGRPMSESCAELATVHPDKAELIWAWRNRAREMIGGPIEDTVSILRELSGCGMPCYALSNWPAETFVYTRERFGFFSYFDGIVISGDEGVAKPDPRIFRRLLTRYRLTPRSTLFIDDHRSHLATAKAMGIRTVQFETPALLRRRLADLGPLDDRNARW